MKKKTINKSSPDLVEQVKTNYRTSKDIGLSRCIQCGLCTSNCPAARHSNYDPREMVKKVLDNDESIFTNEDIWNCFYCYTCQSNCPVKNSPSQINQVLRSLILLNGGKTERIYEFITYGYSFMDYGVGMIPENILDNIVVEFGQEYIDFKKDLDEIRETLGLMDYTVKGEGLTQIKNILKESGFENRLNTFKKAGKSLKDKKDSIKLKD